MSYKYVSTSIGELRPGLENMVLKKSGHWESPYTTETFRVSADGHDYIFRWLWSYGAWVDIQEGGTTYMSDSHAGYNWFGAALVPISEGSERYYLRMVESSNETVDPSDPSTYWINDSLHTTPIIINLSEMEDGREWDESPSYDPVNDPFNELSIGGALADLMQISSAIMDPERFLDVPSAEDDLGAQAACTPMLMTKSMFAAFGTALWSSSVWQSLINIFSGSRDPLNAIISCNDLPIDPAFIPKGADKATKLASVDITGSRFYPVTQRYIAFQMATFNIKEVWGNDKDYTGTNIQIWLPYIGMKTLDPIDVIGATLTVEYKVDLYTGDLVAAIFSAKTVKENTVNFSGLIASFSGNCARPLPLARINNDGFMKSLVGTAALAAVNPTAGMVGAAVGLATASRPLELFNTSVAGAEGALLYQRCYLIVHRDIPVYAEHWREMQGVPQSGYRWLRTLSGYTEVADVDLEPLTGATEAEKAEILTYLTNGVYIN